MGRGLSATEVFAACEDMVGTGTDSARLTGHAVHNFLGRGSKTTVQKYTQEWLAMQNPGPTPTSMGATLHSISQLIEQLVQQAVREEQDKSRRLVDDANDQNRHLAAVIASSQKELEQVRADLAEAVASLAAASEARSRAEHQRDYLRGELDDTLVELADAKAGTVNQEREMEKAVRKFTASVRVPSRRPDPS